MKSTFLPSLLLAVVFHFCSLSASAEEALVRGEDLIKVPEKADGLYLHNLFQENMVLQRGKPLKVWGWAAANDSIQVSFAGQSLAARADADGRWAVTLEPLEANGTPRSLVVKGRDKEIVLDNILVGDVWVLGGQSNMAFPIHKVENGELEIVSANFPQIRMITIPHLTDGKSRENFPSMYQWSDWSSRHFRQGYWDVCSPETVKELSAIGYVFGRRLHMASQVPIGLVDTSIGGTTVESWTSREAARMVDDAEVSEMLDEWDTNIAEFDPKKDFEERLANYERKVAERKEQGREIPNRWKRPVGEQPGPVADRNRPGNCFQGLIQPLEGIQVKGAIFHQGFNNCFDGSRGARIYREIFPFMIGAWRKAFNDSELPFGIISLCTADMAQTEENYCEKMVDIGPEIRAAQYETFRQLVDAGDENVGFASTYDLRRRWFHPQLKVPAGERIARWALATEYGFDSLKWMPPVLEEMKSVDGALHLKFNTDVMAVDDGTEMVGFALAGEDKAYHMAEVDHLVTGENNKGGPVHDRSVIVLTNPFVETPVHFRYAWARNPMGNIQLGRHNDVPLATQRSDRWNQREGPVSTEGMNDRQAKNAMRQAMREIDMKRRLYEARELIESQE
ncbi:hypothetical protein DDZ13_14305 [Coraliomargarita sinensis]|uniref:Uncharacterized protein n=1 Tax=Coraliomargarita sinensis TaxID=2174842 RepID=A0A317ZCW5_9BACT|nr:sialate O-acetylesterase [Coraliomargarita sinensis]PXA02956.1 hypothetical protein DDZ13_14305 [Coraliomargarita sinensis]